MIPLISVIVGMVTVAARPADSYQSRYDHLDVESILNNRRMVSYYAACLLSQGPCPPQGVDFKQILPEALATNCAKCTEKQRTIAYRSVKRLRKEYPKIWGQLIAEWDPQDIFVRKFELSFENEKPATLASPTPSLFNRFGENEDDPPKITSASPAPTTSTSTITVPRTTVTATTSTITTTARSTTKFLSSLTQSPIYVTRATQAPPFTTVGANLQATVSFGTNLVGGIVRSLGTLGSKVVESGTKLANMVISAAFRT